ncbi:MAG: hypothetical protein WEB00_15090 [Dehalococcoidia bacterium]
MLAQSLSLFVVTLCVLGSLAAALLPVLAAWQSDNRGRAARLGLLLIVPAAAGLALIAFTVSSGLKPSAAIAASVSVALLGICGLFAYRRTPEVDRFDKMVLALLGAVLFSPLTLMLVGAGSLVHSIGTTQLLVAAGLSAFVVGLPASVFVAYTVVLRHVHRRPEPMPVQRRDTTQRRMAEAAARELVKDILGEDLAKQAATRGYLEVEGKLCRYRVYPGSFRTAVLNKNGRWIGNLCVIPANSQPIPDYDQLLAKVLMLEHAEEEFWMAANLIDSGPEAWEIRDRLNAERPAHHRNRVEPD